MTEIKSLGDAEKAIEALRRTSPMTRWSMSHIDPMSKARSFNTGLDAALEILRELEASVREEDELYNEALSKWGLEAQVKMGIEECAELIKSLVKYGRNVNYSTLAEVRGEIADVQIILGQLKIIFGKDEIANIMPQKFERLRRVLEGEK